MLHGTGGTEHDLVPIAKLISPESSILSVRGNVRKMGCQGSLKDWLKVFLMLKI